MISDIKGNAFNLAIWQSFGKSKFFMERLHSLEIGFARIFALFFFNFPERYLYQQLYLYSYPLVTVVQGVHSHLRIQEQDLKYLIVIAYC